MVFDPVSIVGFIGTTAGMIGFIASTVPNVTQRVRDFQDCQNRLRWYHSQILFCEERFQHWVEIWCLHAPMRVFSECDYLDFWGNRGFQTIKTLVDLIGKELKRLNSMIRKRPRGKRQLRRRASGNLTREPQDMLTANDWDDWPKVLAYAADPDASTVVKADWVYPFAFALFKSDDFKARISRLKEMITELHDFSRRRYWKMEGEDDVDQVVLSHNVNTLRRRLKQIRLLSTFMNDLYKAVVDFKERSSISWSLVLGEPKLKDLLNSLDNATDINIQFVVEYQNSPKQVVSVSYTGTYDTLTPIVEAYSRENSSTRRDWTTESLKEDLEAPRGRHISRIKLLRATAALNIVQSLVVFSYTRWTIQLCSCGIGCIEKAGSETLFVLRPTRLQSNEHACLVDAFYGRKYLLLGVVLTELALDTPVQVKLTEDHSVGFEIEGAAHTFDDLLENVRRISCSADYTDAVSYCFQLDQALEKQEKRPSLPICLARIVLPCVASVIVADSWS